MLRVPLDHQQPGGETIDLHVARRRGSKGSSRQLWMLAGGPGQGGQVWSARMEQLAQDLPDTDLYAVDHRGTGYSHRLTCPQQDKPGSYGGYSLPTFATKSCLSALNKKGDKEKLKYFTTTQAARDVAAAIEATRSPGQQVYAWGASYGTHWAHRLVQVAPDKLTGVIFDGYMSPERFAFTEYDRGVEEVGKIFAQGCMEDPACAARFGPDPWERARQIAEAQKTSPCGGIYSREVIQAWGAAFLDGNARVFLFPFLHRIERCSPADIDALNHLLESYTAVLSAPVEEEPFLNSGVLQYNIALAELWSLPGAPQPTEEELKMKASEQLFLAGASSYPASLASIRNFWPIAPDDHSDQPLPVASPPRMLWLAGGLDTRTPPQQAARVQELYQGEGISQILIPGAGHTPVLASPLANDPDRTCGMEILLDFVRTGGPPATTCLGQLQPVRYASPSAEFSKQWWGAEDDWGDGEPSPSNPSTPAFHPAQTPSARLAAERWRGEWSPGRPR